jgi:hypothetical protein
MGWIELTTPAVEANETWRESREQVGSTQQAEMSAMTVFATSSARLPSMWTRRRPRLMI